MESSMPPMAPRGPAAGRPAWATVIGIVAIIFGILGILGGCVGGVYMAASGPIADALEEQNIRGMEAQIAQMRSISRYAIPSVVSSVVALGLGAGLLVVGTGLMRQRGWARTAAVTWAWLKIVYSVLAAGLGYLLMRDQFSAMAEADTDPNSAPAMYRFMKGFAFAIVAMQLLWLWALPVFFLIWMSRSSIKEQIATWRSGTA